MFLHNLTEFSLALPELQDNIGSPAGAKASKYFGPMLEGKGGRKQSLVWHYLSITKALGSILEGLGSDHRVWFGIT
jgi:hypothetical protein